MNQCHSYGNDIFVHEWKNTYDEAAIQILWELMITTCMMEQQCNFMNTKEYYKKHSQILASMEVVHSSLFYQPNLNPHHATSAKFMFWGTDWEVKSNQPSLQTPVKLVLVQFQDHKMYRGTLSFMTSALVSLCFAATSKYSTITLLCKNIGFDAENIPLSRLLLHHHLVLYQISPRRPLIKGGN